MSNGDKDLKIRFTTEADVKGANELTEAIEEVTHAAGMPGLKTYAAEVEDAAEAMDVFAEATREEQEELRRLQQLVDTSKAAVRSMQELLEKNPDRKGAANGLEDSKSTLADDQAAVAALKQKIAARVQAAKAAEVEAVATKKAAAEQRSETAAIKEDARQRRLAEQQRRTEDRADDQAANVRRIRQNQIAQGVSFAAQQAAGAAQTLRELRDAAKGMDEELANNIGAVADGFDSLQGAIAGAATGFQAGGPAGAIIGGIVGLAAPQLKTAVDELAESLNRVGEAKAIEAGMPARIEAIKKALDVKEAAASWRDLADAMDLVDRKTDAASKIRAAEDQSKLFQANEAVRVAEATGGDVAGAKAKALEVERQTQSNARRRGISDSLNEVSSLQTRVQGKENQIGAAERSGADSATLESLRDELRELTKALSLANVDSAKARFLAGIQEGDASLKNNNDDVLRLKQAEEQAGDKITQALEAILGKIGDAANTPEVQGKAEIIRNLLKDGFQQGEQNQVAALLFSLVGMIRQGSAQQIQAIQELQTMLSQTVGIVSSLQSENRALKTEVNKLKQNSGNPNY